MFAFIRKAEVKPITSNRLLRKKYNLENNIFNRVQVLHCLVYEGWDCEVHQHDNTKTTSYGC